MGTAETVQPAPSVIQYWDGETPPSYLAGPLASFRDLNPDFEHRIFSEAHAERFIAAHFTGRELEAFRSCAVPAMQADYFRYCSVLALGGVYADVDYWCTAPLRQLLESLDGGQIFLGKGIHDLNGLQTERVWNGLFAFRRPGHPFLRLTLDIATANVEARIAERIWSVGENVREAIWLTVGPGIFTLLRFIHEWGSFDAFVANVAGSVAEPFGELYCEVVGDYPRLAAAFEGIRVAPFEEIWHWVEDVPASALPYKQTGAHWHNHKAAIFR
jgi:Glycosyltransferase sugar-binding region containing DXD motif